MLLLKMPPDFQSFKMKKVALNRLEARSVTGLSPERPSLFLDRIQVAHTFSLLLPMDLLFTQPLLAMMGG